MQDLGKTVKKHYRVNKRDISYIKFIFEACEGIGSMTTICPKSGTIMFCIAPGREEEFYNVLGGVGENIIIEDVKNKEYCIS